MPALVSTGWLHRVQRVDLDEVSQDPLLSLVVLRFLPADKDNRYNGDSNKKKNRKEQECVNMQTAFANQRIIAAHCLRIDKAAKRNKQSPKIASMAANVQNKNDRVLTNVARLDTVLTSARVKADFPLRPDRWDALSYIRGPEYDYVPRAHDTKFSWGIVLLRPARKGRVHGSLTY
jgi:hypothetical protein